MKLGETVTFVVLKRYSCVEPSLYSLYVLSGFSGRAGSDVGMIHIFPQGVPATTTLVWDGAGDGGARARARYELGLLLCSVACTTVLGVGPNLLGQKPWGSGLSWLHSL